MTPASAPIGAGGTTSRPFRGAGALLASGVAARGLGLVKLLLFAPLLGPAAFGAFRLATTASAILSAVAALGLHTCYLRYLPELGATARGRRFVLVTLALASLTSLGVALALAPVAPQIGRAIFGGDVEPALTYLMLASLPIIFLYQAGVGIARGHGLFRESAVGEVGQNVFHIALALGAVVVVGATAASVFGAYVAGLVLSTLLLAFLLRQHVLVASDAASTLPPDVLPRALRFSAWYALIPGFQYLFDFIDRWALARFHGLTLAGAYSLVPIFTGGMTVLGLGLAPVVSRAASEAKAAGTLRGDYAGLWSALVVAAVGSLAYGTLIRIGEPAIWALASGDWQSASPAVPWLLVYFSWFNVYYILGAIASVEEATWLHLASLGLGAAVNLALNLLWVPQFGVFGAAVATAVSLLATAAVHVAFIHSRRIPLPSGFWVALAIPLPLLLPIWAVVAGCLIVAGAVATRTIVVDSDGGRFDPKSLLAPFGRLAGRYAS